MAETILSKFIQESRELLEEAANGFLAWEKNPGETQILNQIFRAVHTMKGSSGLFDHAELTHLLHAAEDLMSDAREGRLSLDSNIVDLMLEALDQVSEWIDCVESELRFTKESVERAASVEARLRRCAVAADDAAAAGDEINWRKGEENDTSILHELINLCDGLAERLKRTPQALVVLHYLPDPQCFYVGEDPFFQARQTPGILALKIDTPSPWVPLADLDPFACQLGFWLLSSAPRKELESHYRYMPQAVQCMEFTADTIFKAAKNPAVSPAAPRKQAILLRFLQQQKELLVRSQERGQLAAIADSVGAVIRNGLMFLDISSLDADLETALTSAKTEGSPAGLLAVASALEKMLDPQDEPPNAPEPEKLRDPAPTSETRQDEPKPGDQVPEVRRQNRFLKVSQDKIDMLLELAGELIVAKNTIPYLTRRAEGIAGARDLARDLKDFSQSMGRMAESFQAAAMQLRLLPISEVCDRFPRIVRDLSRRFGKAVNLETEGADTEAEKSIVERLYDPLLHIIRNSLDHGLEAPEVREAAGKRREGTIRIAARQDRGQLVLSVSDDGRGIDAGVVKDKAIRKGLLTQEECDRLSEAQIRELIFLPGFSTKEEVSDVSGRGVGMDVVRTMAKASNGTVELDSTPGQGTTVTLRLPLTMAVSHVLLVSVGNETFGVPMDSVVETVKIRRKDLAHIKSRRAIVLRGRLIVVQSLSSLLRLDRDEEIIAEDDEQIAVLVVKSLGEEVGLVVDRFHEGIDTIVKPLEGVLARVRGFVGSALLGDGRVLLVLNVGEVLRDAYSL